MIKMDGKVKVYGKPKHVKLKEKKINKLDSELEIMLKEQEEFSKDELKFIKSCNREKKIIDILNNLPYFINGFECSSYDQFVQIHYIANQEEDRITINELCTLGKIGRSEGVSDKKIIKDAYHPFQ